MLHILKLRGTVINIYGPSGIGKTGLLELVSSIFATPDSIITFAATPISITILSERLGSVGMIIDDKQTSFDDSKISTLIYSLAEGRTRLKATKESDLIENRKFELNVITSAEEKLNENSKHTGSSRRTIEIYTNKIFSSNEKSIKAHKKSRENYGLALNIFVNKLIDNYSSSEYQELLKKYEEIEKYLNENAPKETVNSYIQSISGIVLADILMNKIFEFGFNVKSSLEMGLNILSQLSIEKEIDEIEMAREIIEDWILMNDKKFERQDFYVEYNNFDDNNTLTENLDSDKNTVETWGMYSKGIYYIFPTKFNEVIRKSGFSPNKIRRGFAEKGLIKIDEINNRFTVVKFYKGGNRRMLAYKLENESKRVEKEIEEDYEENIVSKNMYKHSINELIETETNIKEFEKVLEKEKELEGEEKDEN